MTWFLYLTTVAIWGTTWLALKWQLGPTAIPFSIAGRFLLAAALLLGFLWLSGRVRVPQGRILRLVLLQGLLLFCCNFLCFYQASHWLPSGLIAVIFSTSTLWNALAARLVLKRQVASRVWYGALFGLVGLMALFWPQLVNTQAHAETLQGLGLALLGTLCFSTGNLLSARLQSLGATPLQTNGWGMLCGATLLLLGASISGVEYVPDPSPRYWWALGYLALFGSVVGFTSYLMLVGRLGPERAAYCTVLFPVVALNLSVWFEGYQWAPVAVLGLLSVMFGNLLVFWRGRLPFAVHAENGSK
ncbi:DMT family transporter [Pseudaeromonas sharmana]|uniref:DMT family transporter n=1 Tax=Pseudaeromonas sharmana TaxID=328412 RepID=A0ABV8CJ62_9GAMM